MVEIKDPRPALVVLTSAVMIVGLACGKNDGRPETYPVSGVLKFEGTPASGAFVVFHPVGKAAPGEQLPTGEVKADGTFEVTSHGEATNSNGAPAGDYAVTVEWYKPVKKGTEFERGPNVIPAQYGKADTTPLKVTVEAKANSLKPFELTR